ncbi:MAG TPA: efflux RND transporter periplasmic adaptor subunit [Thermodesulfobacteriota bacterium]
MRALDRAILAALVILLAGACGRSGSEAEAPGQSGAAAQPPEVVAMAAIQRTTPIYHQLVGQVVADQEVEIRSKATGLLVQIGFRDGQRVRKGQLLFQIDPQPFQADLANARARLAEAQAALGKARQDLRRARALASQGIIARQELTDAQATYDQERQAVAAQQAVVEAAELRLRDARITSPLTGRIGASRVKLGTLVQAGETILAVVSALDPIDVTFSISEQEYLDLFRRFSAAGRTAADAAPVELILADGSVYPHPGHVDFVAPRVSPTTGTLEIRVQFPNPNELLRPGLYANVRVVYDVRDNALLVPQRAVQETLGKTFVTVVTEDGTAEQRAVTLGPRAGNLWIVEDGLEPGERVVVEGLQKAQPGTRVAARMITEAQLASGTAEQPGRMPEGGGPAGEGEPASPSAGGSAAGPGAGNRR